MDRGLRTSQKVAERLVERRFISNQSILDTIGPGTRVPDPQGVAGRFMFKAPANFNGSQGTLEVLVNEVDGIIEHVLFHSSK